MLTAHVDRLTVLAVVLRDQKVIGLEVMAIALLPRHLWGMSASSQRHVWRRLCHQPEAERCVK